MNYLVVLFKNKEKRKIINKFKTYKKALDYYNDKIKSSEQVLFPKMTENGVICDFELGLVEVSDKKKDNTYVKDNLGRNVKIEIEDGFNIIKINDFNIEELFVDYQNKQKISTQQFIKKYLDKPGFKLLSKLNNKIVLQNDDLTFLFTFKTINESDRFIDTLQKLNRKDCMCVKDYNTIHRKYLYEILEQKGYSKSYLQRHLTAHPSKK